jgi:hypothetical protein
VLSQIKFAEEEYNSLASRMMQQEKFLVEFRKLTVAALRSKDVEQDTVLKQLWKTVSKTATTTAVAEAVSNNGYNNSSGRSS